jgi:hypothetical protein
MLVNFVADKAARILGIREMPAPKYALSRTTGLVGVAAFRGLTHE